MSDKGFDMAMFSVMSDLMPTLQKYSDIQPKQIDIKVEKYNEGTIIKIKSDKPEVTIALAEILGVMSKMQTETKVNYIVEDNTS